ncbi:MAG: hypothetical protein EXR72_22745 [Myxococcales bacterium]|nr:hypothetical protein [Myxococcales bacterium]
MPSLRTGRLRLRLRLRLRDEQEPARGPPPLLSTQPRGAAGGGRFPIAGRIVPGRVVSLSRQRCQRERETNPGPPPVPTTGNRGRPRRLLPGRHSGEAC